jgi:nucleotide-binding universal stress UspA family protein
MSYKTILVQADTSGNCAERIRIAIELAQQYGAHLVGAAVTGGVGRFAYPGAWAADPGGYSAFLTAQLDVLRQRAEAALAAFEEAVRNQDLRSHESALIDDEAGPGLNLRGRYCDLLVIGQSKPKEATPVIPADLPQQVVMGSGRPVLLVPFAGTFPHLSRHAMVAWDGSLSAARAVTGALPLLEQAVQVEVAVFTGDAGDIYGDNPGDDVALYLARHEVKVNVVRSDSGIGDGGPLLALATERGADLLVMGGYGHTRLRELVMGGVTRTVLRSMTVPVLMAH